MGLEEQNSLFPYTEEDKRLILKELNLTENILQEGLDSVLDWFEKQPHLVEAGIERYFIERMIIISKGSIERTKKRIDGFYKYRYLAPEFIQTRDVLCDPHSKLWNICSMFPIVDMQEGQRTHYMKFAADLGQFDLADLFRNGFMYVDIRMKYDYWLNDVWVLDFKYISISHIFSLRPSILRKAGLLFQNGLNWRLQAIHLVNLNAPTSVAQRVMDFMKQFFSSLIMSRVIIHESVSDLLKYLPKECVPEDYGGSAPHSSVLIENIEREFKNQKTIDYLLDCAKLVSNESRRPADERSEEALPGSFRRLEVD